MANQGLDRRTALAYLAKAAAASQFPGFCRWAWGAGAPANETAPGPYKPRYFSAAEYRTIEMLTGLIIPKDETPGAQEAGVSEFIDFMAAHGETEIQAPMHAGLAWLDAAAKKDHGDVFARLTADQQTALLTTIAAGATPDKEGANKEGAGKEGSAFFQLIRRYTVMGYYTSRVGLEELNYPGLRFYSQSPACPHVDDPEHIHLPAAKV